MSSVVNVRIHASQFPDAVRRDLLGSLRSRRINHKFHYDSVKQTQKWLALHEAYSPSRNDRACTATYDRAFAEVAAAVGAKSVHVIGLGCGGGQKDTRLLRRFKEGTSKLFYTPSDVSVAMTLVARQTALAVVPSQNCFPLVLDLATTKDLPQAVASVPGAVRVITFFGMIPNFEPAEILPRLAGAVPRGGVLLFSANLAPGADCAAGVRKILPQYDNELTREWLLTVLLDLGVERRDGRIVFGIEAGAHRLKRVVAKFEFARARSITVESEKFTFRRGDAIRLFFSYRYTPDRVRTALEQHSLKFLKEWIVPSGEEGVFLCRRR